MLFGTQDCDACGSVVRVIDKCKDSAIDAEAVGKSELALDKKRRIQMSLVLDRACLNGGCCEVAGDSSRRRSLAK
jgi:hypothetical protein